MWYFVVSLTVTIGYIIFQRTGEGMTLYLEALPGLIVLFMVTIVFLAWWVAELINCNFDENAIPEFTQEAKLIKTTLIGGLVFLSASIAKFLYDNLGKPAGNAATKHYVGFELLGGKRKLTHRRR
jgi:UDP-N-acetylmuramyl pentapeptide phosphotransferase/UDP-N-acetylglucosamine-1-phosphate transferase